MIRFVTITGLVAASASALASQPVRPQARPLPPQARERQLELRERMLERREAMLERRGAARLGARAGFRAGMRAGMGAGMRGPAMRGGRGAMRERLVERRAVAREHYEALKPEQREALFKYRESARTERFRVGEEVRAGKLTREQARERLQKWRETHKSPVELPALRRPGRPEGGN